MSPSFRTRLLRAPFAAVLAFVDELIPAHTPCRVSASEAGLVERQAEEEVGEAVGEFCFGYNYPCPLPHVNGDQTLVPWCCCDDPHTLQPCGRCRLEDHNLCAGTFPGEQPQSSVSHAGDADRPEESSPPSSSGHLISRIELETVISGALSRHQHWNANHSSIGMEDHCKCGDRPRDWRYWSNHAAEMIADAIEERFSYAGSQSDETGGPS